MGWIKRNQLRRLVFRCGIFLLLLFVNCSRSTPQPGRGQIQATDWRWDNPNDFGRSLHPQRAHVIQVAPAIYRPGEQPMGIGARIRALRLIADAYEARHPEVTIEFIQQISVAGGSEGETMRTQLLGGVAPEIVNINTEATWPDIEQKKGWWVPLDTYFNQPNPYVPGNKAWIDLFRNQALTQAKRAPDGFLYCLTFDIVETGIFYNKTLFKKLNLTLPQTWPEFLALQAKIAQAGLIPIVVERSGFADWAPDLIFDQCFYEILDLIDYQKRCAIEEAYYQSYLFPEELCWLIQKGYFSAQNPRFRESWRLLKEWRQYWQKDLTHSDFQRPFVTQRTPMFWTGSWYVRRLKYDPLIHFEWGVFYPPPIPKSYAPACCGIGQAVIGGAGIQLHVTRRAVDDGDLEAAVDFLRFITTPAHASEIANEAGMFISNVRGAFLPQNLAPFAEIVLKRYCTAKWQFSLGHRFTDHRERMVELFLNNGISLDDFLVELEKSMHVTADAFIQTHQPPAPDNVPDWSLAVERAFLNRKETPLGSQP
ncbi:ABC transporter substrate-binding protein [candidate division KSB1 bacterium]|nr:ABC transporter substrate-binding protein [candidate division KSB1 bacterium]